MSHLTNYHGYEIDNILYKAKKISVKNNGYVLVDSSEDKPIDLNNIRNPGNYLIYFWTNGPVLPSEYTKGVPISLYVTTIDYVLYQFVVVANYVYSRKFNTSTGFYEQWTYEQYLGRLYVSDTEPTNKVPFKTLWINTDTSVLKLYDGYEWKELISSEDMPIAIYDNQNKHTDIYTYTSLALYGALEGHSIAEYMYHLEEYDRHVTNYDINNWYTKVTQDQVDELEARLKEDILAFITEYVTSEDQEKIDSLSPNLADVAYIEDRHIDDNISSIGWEVYEDNATSSILIDNLDDSFILLEEEAGHPSEDKMEEWNAKADGDHTHINDDKIIINAHNVVGVIPSNKLPYDITERVYHVSSVQEMYQLQKNPVHNGDLVAIDKSTNLYDWYYVINEDELDNELGYRYVTTLNTDDVKSYFSWNDVTDKPSTIEGYDIEDALTEEDMEILTDIEEINASGHYGEGLFDQIGILGSIYDMTMNLYRQLF